MHEFKLILKDRKPKYLITPDGSQYVWEKDPANVSMFLVQVPDQALVPSDPTNRMTMMMEHIEKRWVKAHMPIFLKFLAESSYIRLKYLEQLGDIFTTVEVRRQVLAYMRKMGGILPAYMGSFKRSGALNDWLRVRLEHSTIDVDVVDPAVSLDQVMKAKQKQAHGKLLPEQILAKDRQEMLVYIAARQHAGASPEEIQDLNKTMNRLPIPELGPSPF